VYGIQRFDSPTLCRIAIVSGAVLAAVLLVGCEKKTNSISITKSPFDPNAPVTYLLYPGDELLIRYPTDPDLDQQVPIRSDGMISLPYVGEVQAAHRTPAELADELNKKYHGLLKRGAVTVIVKKETGRRIYIGGQVLAPGTIQLRPNQTLVQALFETGGLTAEANSKQITILRYRMGEGSYVMVANVDRILAGNDRPVRLEPFDVIYVPQSRIAKIDQFVQQHINLIIPRAVSFPFTTELHAEPVRIKQSAGRFTATR